MDIDVLRRRGGSKSLFKPGGAETLQPLPCAGEQAGVAANARAEIVFFPLTELLELVLGERAVKEGLEDVAVVHAEGAAEVIQGERLRKFSENARPGAVMPVEGIDEHAVHIPNYSLERERVNHAGNYTLAPIFGLAVCRRS